MNYLINGIGIAGVACIVCAYYLIANGKLNAENIRYHLLNFCGASLIMLSLMFHWNTPSVVIESVWMCISGWGIFRCLKAKRQG